MRMWARAGVVSITSELRCNGGDERGTVRNKTREQKNEVVKLTAKNAKEEKRSVFNSFGPYSAQFGSFPSLFFMWPTMWIQRTQIFARPYNTITSDMESPNIQLLPVSAEAGMHFRSVPRSFIGNKPWTRMQRE
ncbi:hypothetical protein F2P81_007353 [Scophthalmus maximus]|uniref:Uncharacterized protein n=1 Tax=Scophthalmus maximus TaxID=52904 RepID=A0A6A4T8E0_SCOMX|nr:hypothetical protein F2P81_007353 [Scophthalmus maximus]